MPADERSRLERVELRRSVRAAFAESRTAFLPPEMVENSASSWILGFDELLENPNSEKNGSGGSARAFQETLIRTAQGERGYPLHRAELAGLNDRTKRCLNLNLSRKVDFYFSTLFLIGRMLKVSERAADAAREILSEIGKVRFEFPTTDAVQFSEKYVANFARKSLVSVQERGSAAKLEAGRLWYLWLKEVELFKEKWLAYENIVDREIRGHLRDFEAGTYAVFVALSDNFGCPLTRSSSLYRLCKERNFIPPEVSANYEARVYDEEYDGILGEWAKYAQAVALRDKLSEVGSGISQAMFSSRNGAKELAEATEYFNELHRRYATDPFLPYDTKPADETLYRLIRESDGPGEVKSPWFSSWIRRLPGGLERGSNDGPPANVLKNSGQFSTELAASADATIKRALVDVDRRSLERNDEYIQRVFEKKWIETLARSWKERSTVPKLREEILEEVLISAVAGLMERGYSITVPQRRRLSTLVERVSRNDLPYHELAW